MKKIFIICMILAAGFSESGAQPLFVENFNFPVRDTLDIVGGWDVSGLASNYHIKVISPGLLYSGYIGSGIGNTAYIYNQGEGDISLNRYTPVSSGKIYLAFLLRIDSLSAGMNQSYQVALDEEGATTNINSKAMIKRLSATTFNFGIRKSDSAAVYSSTVFSANITYLVVVKYVFVSGAGNDSVKLYVSSSGVPTSEPSSPIASQTSGYDIPSIGEVVVTNSFAQFGGYGVSAKADGIRVATNWNDLLFVNTDLKYRTELLIQGFYNSVTNKMVKDTARVYLRYNTPPYQIADSSRSTIDSTGKGVFSFARIGNNAPYYIVVRHRNSIETWSSNTPVFINDSLRYEFTFSANQAYGANEILKGSKYCIYNGDVNQEGFVDLTDLLIIYNGANNFLTGYVASDLNGDNYVDLTDLVIAFNNSMNFVQSIRP